MSKKQRRANEIADIFVGKITTEAKIKKLGEELVELAMAIQSGDKAHTDEELGDCMYFLSHIAHRNNKGKSHDSYLHDAAEKLIHRRCKGKPKKLKKYLKYLGKDKG